MPFLQFILFLQRCRVHIMKWNPTVEEYDVTTWGRRSLSLFVDKSRHQWVVCDGDGDFWIIPFLENCWDRRQPYRPAEDAKLEPVPGHYLDLIGLPLI